MIHTKPSRRMLALVLALAGTAAVAQDGLGLDCTAAGYDVLIANPGPETVVAGTRIAWNVRFVRHSGDLELERDLPAGESVFVSGGLGSDYLSSPQPCEATIAADP